MPKKNGKPYNHELQCLLCEYRVFANGLCRKHYSAAYYREKAAPLKARIEPRLCSIDNCDRLTDTRSGLCPKHQGRARRWGMTPAQLNGWLAIDSCESCGNTERLVLDHDHSHCERGCRDCIRGVLCGGCNSALGFLREDTQRIRSLEAYAARIS